MDEQSRALEQRVALLTQFASRLFIGSFCRGRKRQRFSFEFGIGFLAGQLMQATTTRGSIIQRVSAWLVFHTLAKLVHTLARYAVNNERSPTISVARALIVSFVLLAYPMSGQSQSNEYLFNDSHFHLTNYIQEGIDIHDFLKIMGTKAGRVALFGIPLQQQWSYRVDENRAPTYYLNSDAPLYYYSFTDAWIAMAYKSLSKEEQARFDPMITGFNPTDMYAADHIRRVLKAFPGVFTGIGEFSIHKEFVSAKISGVVASLFDPALDRLVDFAGEVGLVILIHNDVDVPFAKPGAGPAYAQQIQALFLRHPNATFIWAHIGVGRIIRPIKEQAAIIENVINDPKLSHVYFDISWDEVAKYIVATPESTKNAAALVNRHPDRFL